MSKIHRFRMCGRLKITDALTRILNEFDKNPEVFLEDEFKRSMLVDMVRDLCYLSDIISQTKNGALSYGNAAKCDRVLLDLEYIKQGSHDLFYGNFSSNVLHVADTVALELEHNTQVLGPNNIYSGSPTYIGTHSLDRDGNLWRHKHKRNSVKVADKEQLLYEEIVEFEPKEENRNA